MTVNTPTAPVTIATSAPTPSAMWTASLAKNPGANTGVEEVAHETISVSGKATS